MNLRKVTALAAALALAPAAIFISCSKRQAPPLQADATPPVLTPPQAPRPPPPDPSSPKGVSLAFANAVAAGDAAAMRKLAAGADSRMLAYYAGFTDLVASQHLFTTALKARFGDDCLLPPEIEHLGNLPPMPSNFDELTEKIDGDKAVLVDASGHTGVRLRKVDGNWKVDFDAVDAALPPGAAESIATAQQQFAATKKGFDQTTAKIIDGTYTDCQSALDGLKTALGPQQ
jgi:hypothetical protein